MFLGVIGPLDKEISCIQHAPTYNNPSVLGSCWWHTVLHVSSIGRIPRAHSSPWDHNVAWNSYYLRNIQYTAMFWLEFSFLPSIYWKAGLIWADFRFRNVFVTRPVIAAPRHIQGLGTPNVCSCVSVTEAVSRSANDSSDVTKSAWTVLGEGKPLQRAAAALPRGPSRSSQFFTLLA